MRLLTAFVRATFIVGVSALSLTAARAQTAAPTPAGPTRIVIECEDMHGVAQDRFGPAPGWQVGRWGKDLYQNMIFGGVWASGMRTAMTDAGTGPAEAYSDIDVPTDGTYKVWAKYECPPFFNYAFGVRIDPLDVRGKPVFDKVYGLIDAAKHYSFNNQLIKGSLYWSWGIDHDAAEGYEVPLSKGRYRVTLYKTANPEPAGARSVDALLITSDLSELSSPHLPRYPMLDELRRANHVYFRFRNLSDTPEHISWNHWGHRYPDYYQAQYRDLVRFYDANGQLLPDTRKTGDWPIPIAPGQASVWYDLGPTMNTESSSPYWMRALPAVALPNAGIATPNLPFAVDIALQPDEKHIVKSFALGAGETELTLLVQPDLNRPDGVQYTKKLVDVYADITNQLNAAPRLGPVPKKLKLFGETSGPRPTNELSWDFDTTQAFRDALGLNTIEANMYNKKYIDAMAKWHQPRGGLIERSLVRQHSTDIPRVVAEVNQGVQDNFYALSFGDEIGLPPADAKDPKAVAAFQDYIRAQGETAQSLGLASWDQVKPLGSLSADVAVRIGVLPQGEATTDSGAKSLKRLFWYSSHYADEQGIAALAAKTRDLKAALGDQVQTTCNLGGMMPFFWMPQSAFIESFKGNAMSLAWTEDYTYCQPEASRLVVDFEAAYLRKGASYHDTPMMFYCMPHYPGNSPEHLMQNAVLEWAQNVKDLDWFVAGPDGWSTENYVTYRNGMPIFQALRTLSGMAGLIEDDLLPARPNKTPVAMLLSQSSDVWETEGNSQNDIRPAENGQPATVATNVTQEERKNIWYALRLAGYRVDFVTEADVRDGLLKNYNVVYMSGQNLDRKAASILKQWVHDGGALMATAGAARKDEFDEPLTTLDEVLGRGAQTSYRRYRGPLRAKMELLFEKPLDRVQTARASMDALCSKETFAPDVAAQVLGRYATDNSAAWVLNRYGQGNAYYTGTLPGEAFVQKSLPVVPMGKGGPETNSSQFEPVDYNEAARAMILRPLTDLNLPPDVTIGHRSVVAGRLSSARSTVIPLVNLAQQHDGQLKDLSIVVDGIAAKPARVWSCFHRKGIPFTWQGGRLSITLPTLDAVDVVVIGNGS